jgi:hypothetical protein
MPQPQIRPYNKETYDNVEAFIVLFKASVSEKTSLKKLETFPLFLDTSVLNEYLANPNPPQNIEHCYTWLRKYAQESSNPESLIAEFDTARQGRRPISEYFSYLRILQNRINSSTMANQIREDKLIRKIRESVGVEFMKAMEGKPDDFDTLKSACIERQKLLDKGIRNEVSGEHLVIQDDFMNEMKNQFKFLHNKIESLEQNQAQHLLLLSQSKAAGFLSMLQLWSI